MLLAAAGALSMLAQVVILRELVAALYGVELLYVLALGSWLVGTAIGAGAGRHLPANAGRGIAGCILLALLVPAEVLILRAAGPTAGTVAGAYLPFPVQLAWIAASTIPPAAVCGWLFPALADFAAAQGQPLGRSYAWESAGAAAAGAGVTVAMWAGASTLQVAIAAPALAIAAGMATAPRWPRRRRAVLACCAGVAVIVPAAWAHAWDVALLRRMYPALVDAADTPYARVAITRQDSQVVVFENGALAFDTEGTSAEAFADLAAVQHPQPRRALVIGGGGEGVADALARHAVGQIENLEIDRRAFELVRRHTTAAAGATARGGRVSVRFEEPRRYLDGAGSYDLILIAAGEPASGASSRFYTREFFERCARRLTRDGVVALRLAAAENVWPAPLVRRTASIVSALREAFDSVELVAGATLYLFASNGALSTDPGELADRLRARGVRPRLITPPYLAYLYTNDRREEVATLLRAAATDRPNRDAAPVCYQYAAMMWLSTFYPDLAAASGRTEGAKASVRWVALGLLAAGMILWARRRSNRRAVLCLAGVGFIGMVLETVLLLRYQIANGIVYQQVGWLLTCFMAGMTLGAFAAGGPAGGAGREPLPRSRLLLPIAVLAPAIASFVATAWLPSTAGLTGTSLLLAAAGAAVGGAFAAVGRLWRGQARVAASSLYAADVAGGAAGAVTATLVLVPAVGLDWTALVAAALAAALFAVIPRSGPGGR
jgi:spermidine synthase